ncbi:MAG TPA: acylphosphatase [Candidatus Woesearchaeota archaeon]|nr:acylphosphatase [Candidatus Woesearchaeota archaeon]
MGRKSIKARIIGSVQGVGFRWHIYTKAKNLGLRGYVRNLKDGTVEAVFSGDDDKVEKMLEHCYKGPSYALVNRVDIENVDKVSEKGFEIRL